MRSKWLLALASGGVLLTGALLVLVGCGGGGGPITPPSQPPGPSLSQEFVALMPAGQKGSSYVGTASCLSCHSGAGSATMKVDVAKWNTTKHSQTAVGCEQCHGPGANHAANPADHENNILEAPTIADSVVCGQCHGPTYAQYKASAHATAVEDVMESAKTNPAGEKICMRCHSGKMRAEFVDNTLEVGGLTADQIDANLVAMTNAEIVEFAETTHESPTCANCHDPHYTTGKLTWQGHEVQLLRQQGNTDDSVVGQPSTPNKTVITFDHTCAVCHMSGTSRTANGSDTTLATENSRGNQHEGPQYYMLSGHGAAETITVGGVAVSSPPVVRRTAHFEVPGQCSHCHMPNGNHTMTVNLDISCQPCHTPGDAAARTAIRGEIQNALFVIRTRMESWAKAKFGDPDLWNYSSLIDPAKKDRSTTINNLPPTDPGGIPLEIRRARHNYIFMVVEQSYGIHNPAYSRYMVNIAMQNLDALGVPRSASIRPSAAQVQATLKADRDAARKAHFEP